MKSKIIVGLILIVLHQVGISQTDSITYGLKGKVIRALSKTQTSPVIFYAGLKGDSMGTALMYKSENFGKTWLPLNNGASISPYSSDIQAISIASDHSIYAGTWKDGLFKSIDDGTTWNKLHNVPSSDIRSIKTGIQTPLLVYASTSSFGVIKSIDGGRTWIRNKPNTIDRTFKFAWSIEIDEQNDSIVFAQTYNNGVWKSTNQGDSWKQILDTKGKVSWDMKISKNSKTMWVVSSTSGDTISSIYLSKNQGNTWEELDDVPQIGINQINVLEQGNKHTIYIGSWKNGIFALEDKKWIKREEVDFNVISEILLNGTELLIGSWGNGIYTIK